MATLQHSGRHSGGAITTRLTARAAGLRAWWRTQDQYMLGSFAAIALLILVRWAALGFALAPPAPTAAEPLAKSGAVLVFVYQTVTPAATPMLAPAPAQVQLLAAPAVSEPAIAAEPLSAEAPAFVVDGAPAATPAGYVAHTTAGDLFIPDSATPVPAGAVYDGPFLAPAATAQPPSAPRLCTGFGDSRDYDPMFASSPACKPIAP